MELKEIRSAKGAEANARNVLLDSSNMVLRPQGSTTFWIHPVLVSQLVSPGRIENSVD